MAHAHGDYYLPQPSHWPIVASTGLFLSLGSVAAWVNDIEVGKFGLLVGLAIIFFVMAGWFGEVIRESESGLYNDQVDRSFRWGMIFFITTEVFFFAAFFGALFYTRAFSLDWLSGIGDKGMAHEFLWPNFSEFWPSSGPAHVGGELNTMEAWGIPALNTLILLTSGVTVTWAHHGLRSENRKQLIQGLFLTFALGLTFVGCQAYEYGHAITHMNLTLGSGIYGSVFFMLTGFHGFHVTVGSIMLITIWVRSIKGHFTPQRHFAFEAVAWYWHFVDIVWLGLFIFVYWI
ncbi:cytochrome c oxidase subunit 3 [Candidatus Nitrosacidococcus sp. I8]|uniref:cytochrome c oxidase subunit 3 n=1 Tax=Candidatus Nitrosacidococcus sp. I8 TaxID=2942908 RepID=UPI0022280023|nr:cytochrome c oxidase subunit 3 [Candidatus Nitrosacidococcus sp. I8]CAH9019851.1 Cytochrome c oxidase subunit 3 [Candidatus Nitrosacidococcus sp. I8]